MIFPKRGTRRLGDPRPKESGRKQVVTSFGVSMIIVLVMALMLKLTMTQVQVSGVSMLPTFKDGRRLTVSKMYWLFGPIKENDVVVVRDASPQNPSGYFIKRVYKLAGEEVDVVNWPRNYSLAEHDRYVVPANHVFVLGDNRPRSEDSRAFGAVAMDRVIGKVILARP